MSQQQPAGQPPVASGLSEQMLRVIRGEVAPEEKAQQYNTSLER